MIESSDCVLKHPFTSQQAQRVEEAFTGALVLSAKSTKTMQKAGWIGGRMSRLSLEHPNGGLLP